MFNNDNTEDEIIEIYKLYYLDVYRYLICFTGNHNDTEDLTQEVFIRVLKNLTDKNRIHHLKAWILSIARHTAIDHYRKKRWQVLINEKILRNVASGHQPIDILELDELKKGIHAGIAKLKPHFRSVVILRAINECSIKETAEILQCSESKVKVDYHRALKELKKILNPLSMEVLSNAR
ncbi:RNA polymerase sigma factor [Bacillus sp. Au-Bac7]|uniref:RNA polymerase sigma factor n=1 Tax=Bacillus sp. Au-Bac7 TaxID=2906458 RepID=UPI001E5C4AC6|nr:RNA polymerase sigma factor [Bacillus sp. Au-Bac7]MCE4051043.1 RNA polymerase sigma factor [Bacillus sp. Au-Bac7]